MSNTQVLKQNMTPSTFLINLGVRSISSDFRAKIVENWRPISAVQNDLSLRRNDSTGGKRLLIWGTIGMAGFCESQSLCHRTRGSPFQRVDAGTAPAEPLGTQSALNANFRLEFRRVRGATLLHASTVAVLCWNPTPL